MAVVATPSMVAAQAILWKQSRGLSPSPRSMHAMVQGDGQPVAVLFGGLTALGRSGETWERHEHTWTQKLVVGPTPRFGHAMAFDDARGVAVLFGGDTAGGFSGETWEWDGTTWTLRTTSGPAPRAEHAMAYDPLRGVTVLYGGKTAGGVNSETWEWNGSTWTQRMVSGPGILHGHCMAYHSDRGEVVLFGGRTPSGIVPYTWTWDGASWVLQSFVDALPSPRAYAAMTYDALRGIVVSGGEDFGSNPMGDTWAWNGGIQWQNISFGLFSPRSRHAIAFDSVHDKTVLFGGVVQSARSGETLESDSFVWFWVQAFLTGPIPRDTHAMAYDPARSKAVLFGGYSGSSFLQDTWEWDGTGGGTWTQKSIPGPSARFGHAMAHDTARNLTVLFGGDTGVTSNQTWEWDSAAGAGAGTWTQRMVAGPTARREHAMVYDAGRGVTVLFGGVGGGVRNGETWEWNGTVWTQRMVAGPSARNAHAMAYDAARGVTVLFGGFNGTVRLSDTWEWNGAGAGSWTQRVVSGPPIRGFHSMAYDASRGVTVLFGGSSGTSYLNDTWEWNGNGAGTWTYRGTGGPSARNAHAMVYDAARSETVLFGGYTGSDNGETWTTLWAAPGVTAHPTSRMGCSQGWAVFSMSASGTVPITYEWQVQTAAPPIDAWQTLDPWGLLLPCGGNAFASTTNSPVVSIGIYPCPGDPTVPQHFQIRCVVTNDFGTIATNEATYTICPADYDCSGALAVADIFSFLNAWFAGSLTADFDGVNALQVADIFAFLNAWFAGC